MLKRIVNGAVAISFGATVFLAGSPAVFAQSVNTNGNSNAQTQNQGNNGNPSPGNDGNQGNGNPNPGNDNSQNPGNDSQGNNGNNDNQNQGNGNPNPGNDGNQGDENPVEEVIAPVIVPVTHTVTLCHATNSDTNPYVVITVDTNAAGGGNNDGVGGHSTHTGPIWNATLKDSHTAWGDIIPSFDYGEGDSFDGLNWTSQGQAIFNNGCSIPTEGGQGGDEDQVTLCHATDSRTNPYVQITVAAAGAYNGHYTQHTGPLFPSMGEDGKWGDIIPPFNYQDNSYSLNWTSQGQAIFNNGCAPVGGSGGEETPPPVVTPPVTETGVVLGASTVAETGGMGAESPSVLPNTGANDGISFWFLLDSLLVLAIGAYSRKAILPIIRKRYF